MFRLDRRARTWALVATVLTGIAGSGAVGQTGGPDAGERRLRSAAGLLHKDHPDLAAEEYRKFLEAWPGHAGARTAHYGLAVCLFRMGKPGPAAQELDRIEDLEGFEFAADALLLRAQCAIAEGEFADAAQRLGRLRKEYPRFDKAREAMLLEGEALYRAGRHKDAVAVLDRLIGSEPDEAMRVRADFFWALSSAATGQDRDAAERLARVRESGSSDIPLMFAALTEGQCRQRLEEWDAAAKLYEVVIAADDAATRDAALVGLAQVERRRGNGAGAGEVLERLDVRNASPAARFERARALFDAGKHAQALEAFDGLAGRDGGALADDAAYWAARCEAAMDEPGKAGRRLAGALRAHDSSELKPWMQYELASVLAREDEHEKAIEVFSAMIEDAGGHPLAADALAGRAASLQRLGRAAESTRDCEAYLKAHAEKPRAPDMRVLLGECAFAAGEYDRAAEALGEFLEQSPSDPRAGEVAVRRGLALARMNKGPEARAVLEGAIERGAQGASAHAARMALGDEALAREDWASASRWFGEVAEDGNAKGVVREDALLKSGLARQRAGDARGALGAYETLVRESPGSARACRAMFEAGQALVVLERAEEAQGAFERVVAMERERDEKTYTPHAVRHLAALASARGDASGAADLLGRLEGVNGQDASDVAVDRGAALLAAGKYEEARGVLAPVVGAKGRAARRGEAQVHYAIALSRLDRHEEALAVLEEAEREGESGVPAELAESAAFERGWCLRALGRLEEAERAWAPVAQDASSRLGSHAAVEIAQCRVDRQEYTQAIEVLRQRESALSGRNDPQGNRAAYLRGLCEHRLGHPTEAIAALAAFSQREDDSAMTLSARLLLGDALLAGGDAAGAAGHLSFVAEHARGKETRSAAMLRWGEALGAMSRWAKSEEVFAAYLRENPESPVAYQAQFGIGWARENDGKRETAIEAYRVVAEAQDGPTAARAQFQIGECLFGLNRHEEAIRELLKVDVLYAHPQWSAAALYEAGRCFAAMDKPEQAQKQFREVAERFPETEWAGLARERLGEEPPAQRPATKPRRQSRTAS